MRLGSRLALVSALAGSLLAAGCSLVFLPPLGQHLDLSFTVAEGLERGDRRLVASWVATGGVDTRRRTLQLSGTLVRPEDEQLPRELVVTATVSEAESGKVRQRIRLGAAVTPEDRFRVSKKIRRDLEPGDRVEVTVEPVGGDLPAGTGVRLCLDLVAAKGHLRSMVSCAAGDGPTTFAAIQEAILTPSCATAGCHDAASAAAGLVLAEGEAYEALVDAPSSQVFGRARVAPGKPDASYLVDKIRGSTEISGGRMPLGGPFLTDDRIAGVVEWIQNGARPE